MIYKLRHQSYRWGMIMALFFAFSAGNSQNLPVSKYGTSVMKRVTAYKEAVAKEPAKKMRELKKLIPRIAYDLRYAGTNNFIGRRMYPIKTNQTFLRAPAAEALAKVQEELNSKNLGLKIFDAYRPYSVTVTFWELIKDERYVANPSKGSGHNRGLAVDLTIIDLTTGHELDMGTGFDSFSDSSHHSFTSLSEMVLQNRRLFKEIMTKYGFQIFETEGWHYSWPNDKEYEVMDISFRKLIKTMDKQ